MTYIFANRYPGGRLASKCAPATVVSLLLALVPLFAQDQKAPASDQQKAFSLDPGKALQFDLAGGERRRFTFVMAQGQYSTITADCGGMRAGVRLFNPSGSPFTSQSLNEAAHSWSLEIVSETSGPYAVEIENQSPKLPPGTCKLGLAPPRDASGLEHSLQKARELEFQANELERQGKYDEALESAEKCLDLREQLLGPDDALNAVPLFILGNIYHLGKTEYAKAEPYYLRALRIAEKTQGPQVLISIQILNNLGTLYSISDRLDEAERTLERAITVEEKAYTPEHPMIASSLVNLANVCDAKADYAKAKRLYERALAILEQNFGPDYPGVSTIVMNISGVYAEMGDYLNAQAFGKRALDIAEKSWGPEHGRLGIPLLTLGDAYRLDGQPEKAEPLYDRALKILEKSRGPDHPYVADTLSYLAEIYHDRRDFSKAASYEQRALAIREKKLGADDLNVGTSLDQLGSVYRDQGDYARAESFYLKALDIREHALGPDHPDVIKTLSNLSAMQTTRGNFDQAESLLARIITTSERNANLNLVLGSERQKLAYLRLLSSQLSQAITLNALLAPQNPAARDLALTTVLQRKGRVLDLLSDSLINVRKHFGPNDAQLLDQFNDATSQLARLVLSGPQQGGIEEHQKRINAVKEERENLESQISVRSAEFRAASAPVTIDAVRAALPPGVVLLEFVAYNKYLSAGITEPERQGESRYIVYALTREGDVQWSELGAAKDIDTAIDAFRLALRNPKRGDADRLARVVDEKILQPMRGALTGAKLLLISPDGQLSLVPFEALVDAQGHHAVERYSITYLSSGRDLLRLQLPRPSGTAPVLVANPLFGEPNGNLVANAEAPKAKPAVARTARRSITTGSDFTSLYFAPLEGTKAEAQSIQALFPEARVLIGDQASEAALEGLNAPKLLHIASHGFFLEDSAQSKQGSDAASNPENPLLRSGLALSGANLSKGSKGRGILTALQASNLNLWGTKLVALSACDTGVGEVKNGEGVYGLRRAFFLAGTESLVMSLWPVSDYVTRELMTQYYTGLKKGLGRGEALHQAQLAMFNRKGRQHPFYWASFIQSGEWANLDGKR
jgi:CHAT domain-containing protein